MKKEKHYFCAVFIETFFLINIYYLEGTLCNIFVNAINTVAASQQAEHSAGESIASFLSKLSFFNDHIVLLQLLLFLFTGGLFCLIIKKVNFLYNLIQRIRDKRITYVIGYWWIYGVIFVSYDQFASFYQDYGITGLDLSSLNRLIILGITVVGMVAIIRFDLKDFQQYINKKNVVLFVLVLGYISFASCGEYLFLSDKNVVWNISLQTVSIYLLFCLWLTPLIIATIKLLLKLPAQKSTQVPFYRKRDILPVVGIMVIGYAWYLFVVYPGIITPDGIVAWTQIMNDLPLTREFPAFLKIIWKVCYMIYPDVVVVTVLQIILWISVVIVWLSYFMKNGMSRKSACIIAFLTSATTPFNLFVLLQESNVYYTIALLWVTYFLVRFVNDYSYFNKNFISMWGLCISLVAVFVSRNEGKVTYAIIIGVLLVLGLTKKNIHLMGMGVSSLLLILVIQGPMFTVMSIPEFQEKSDNSVNLLVNDVTLAVIHFDGTLSEESLKTLEKYTTLEDISSMYNDFGYDCEADGSISQFIANDNEVFKVAWDSIIHNIPIAFRERLNKTESVWNIVAVPNVKQAHWSTGIVENDLGLSAKSGLVTKIFTQLLYYPTFMICVLDVIIYRSGLSICILLVLCLVWLCKCRTKQILTVLPSMAHVVVLVLSLLWPCSRHTWGIVLMTWLLLLNHFYTGDRDESIGDCSGIQ